MQSCPYTAVVDVVKMALRHLRGFHFPFNRKAEFRTPNDKVSM
jgi:hypothetical protein